VDSLQEKDKPITKVVKSCYMHGQKKVSKKSRFAKGRLYRLVLDLGRLFGVGGRDGFGLTRDPLVFSVL
jgi:hypothetical protein